MKKILLVSLIIFISFGAFSQTVIKTDSEVKNELVKTAKDTSIKNQISDTISKPCKGSVNISNKTENDLSIIVYSENPLDNPLAKKIYMITLATGNVKKIRILPNNTYYYEATNNTGAPVFGGYQNYNGTFEIEKCSEIIEEVIR